MYIIFALSVVINSLMTMRMELPSVYPEEISCANLAAFFSGRDRSGLFQALGLSGGYIHALFYAPVFSIFNNPYVIYKAALIVNAVIVSFIPPVVYHLASKLGVERMRHKLLTALCCGMYYNILASSKVIRSDAFSCLLVWLLAWCVFAAWDKKKRSARFTASVLAGFLCAAGFAADTDLIAAAAAVLFTALTARLFLREKVLNIPAFLLSLAASFIAEYFARRMIFSAASGSAAELIPECAAANGTVSFIGTVFGELYSFMTGSFGMGALGTALFVVMLRSRIKEGRAQTAEVTLEDGTKVYEPVKRKYNSRLVVFALFQFFIVITTVLIPVITYGGDRTVTEVGERTARLAPFALFFVLVFVVTYGVDLKKLLFGTGIYAYICLCFGLTYYQESGSVIYSEMPLLMPFRLEDNALAPPMGMSYVIMSSCVFSVFALLLVLSSCARKHITRLVSITMLGILIYNTCFTAIVYLPQTAERFKRENVPYKEVSRILFNDSQSPQIIVYESEAELAGIIQFLEFETKVSIMDRNDKVPESCLLIAKNGIKAPFEGGSYDIVGKTSAYTVYAYGETARDFIRYSSALTGAAASP